MPYEPSQVEYFSEKGTNAERTSFELKLGSELFLCVCHSRTWVPPRKSWIALHVGDNVYPVWSAAEAKAKLCEVLNATN